MAKVINSSSATTFERKVGDSLPRAGAGYLVALSGGADSVALLVALHSLGADCIGAHCNYHLRDEESNRDEQHARRVCHRLGIDIVVEHFDVEAYRKAAVRPTSIEMACRELRYDWFEQLRCQLGCDFVAVAHNADDNAETMIMNMLRGSGITGLRGMLPLAPNHVCRPMLECSRADIEEYLQSKGFDFVVDSSNLTDDYRRNVIRHNVVPAMRKVASGADAALSRTLAMLRENEAFYRQAIEEKHRQYSSADGRSIDLARLTAQEPHARLLLFEWFRSRGLSSSQAEDILSDIEGSGRQFLLPDGSRLLVDRSRLLIECPGQHQSMSLDDLFEISIHPIDEFAPEKNPAVAYFDAAVLDGEPLLVRCWREGDRLQPYGMKGSRKLSDIFSDAKLSLIQKQQVPILVKGSDILWVAGFRASCLYHVTSSTRSFIRVKLRG